MRLPAAVYGVRVTNQPVSDKRQARLPVPVKMIACLRVSHLTLSCRGSCWDTEDGDANSNGGTARAKNGDNRLAVNWDGCFIRQTRAEKREKQSGYTYRFRAFGRH